MKKLLSFSIIWQLSIALMAQDSIDNSWVYRVHFDNTGETIDSVFQYTNVFMEINSGVLQDSCTLLFKIGSDFGLSDIMERRERFIRSLLTNENISGAPGTYRFFMGKYLIRPEIPFIVDLEIEISQSTNPETE